MYIFSLTGCNLTGYNHFDGWPDVSFIIIILSIVYDAILSGPRMKTHGIDLNPAHNMEPSSVNPQCEEELPRRSLPSPAKFQ